jgi:hypothetical protein
MMIQKSNYYDDNSFSFAWIQCSICQMWLLQKLNTLTSPNVLSASVPLWWWWWWYPHCITLLKMSSLADLGNVHRNNIIFMQVQTKKVNFTFWTCLQNGSELESDLRIPADFVLHFAWSPYFSRAAWLLNIKLGRSFHLITVVNLTSDSC